MPQRLPSPKWSPVASAWPSRVWLVYQSSWAMQRKAPPYSLDLPPSRHQFRWCLQVTSLKRKYIMSSSIRFIILMYQRTLYLSKICMVSCSSGLMLTFSTPFCCALFPQRAEVSVSNVSYFIHIPFNLNFY